VVLNRVGSDQHAPRHSRSDQNATGRPVSPESLKHVANLVEQRFDDVGIRRNAATELFAGRVARRREELRHAVHIAVARISPSVSTTRTRSTCWSSSMRSRLVS
jgi:hypothetical protein